MSYSKWQVEALLLCFALPTVAQPSSASHIVGTKEAGCAANPLSVVIKDLHIRQEDSIEALAQIAFKYRICIGLEARDTSVTIDEENISVAHAFAKLFPGSLIQTDRSVIQIKGAGKEASWLDYKINLFQVPRASLYFCGMQLFFAIRDQVYPRTGYIASLPEPSGRRNIVDAFRKRIAVFAGY